MEFSKVKCLLNKVLFSRYMLRSLLYFASGIFIGRKYDVVFYYPQHFNRSGRQENLYFKPLIDICKHNNISYVVFEEPDTETRCPRDNDAVPFDFIFLLLLFFRKIAKFKNSKSLQEKDWALAKLLKPIFFKKFNFNNYIVLSQSMLSFFRGLDKYASLYDYQHGIIYSTHWGYFTNGNAVKNLKLNNANVLVHGKGFKNLMQKFNKDRYYDSHVFILGYSCAARGKNAQPYNRNILFSLSISEFSYKVNQSMLEEICSFLSENKDFFTRNNIKFIFKHHPRFQHDIDDSRLLQFSFATFSNDTLEKCLENCSLHVTFCSTVTFEAAVIGMPTVLYKIPTFDIDFFEKEYFYPIPSQDREGVLRLIKNYYEDKKSYEEASGKVKEWGKYFCTDIDKELFLKILNE